MSNPATPNPNTIPLPDVLTALDGPFAEFAIAVSEDRYAFWLGSGISFTRMPSLANLIKKMLSRLFADSDHANAGCSIKASLIAIVQLAKLSDLEKARVDYANDPLSWPDIDTIASRLADHYALVLDQPPAGKEEDYLLWDVVNVVGTYANPATAPAAEHRAIAALIAEGVASKLASANWDDLIEKAISDLTGNASILRVNVLPTDIQNAELRGTLYKFHGCAACAGRDEVTYRKGIVGRKSQIDGWAAKNQVIAAKLEDLAKSKRTLMLGLSAQDTNIQDIFVKASAQMPWQWPSHPPAYVFSDASVGMNQRGLLKNVYTAHYTAASEQDILSSALFPVYAAPLLTALWLKIIELKLHSLLGLNAALPPTSIQLLKAGIKRLRDRAAVQCDTDDRLVFLDTSIGVMNKLMVAFREGRIPTAADPKYSAISSLPTHSMTGDPQIASSGLTELAIALGLLGMGDLQGAWNVSLPDILTVRPAAIQIDTAAPRPTQIFFAMGDQSALQLDRSAVAIDDDALVIIAHESAAPLTRSPTGVYGRTGASNRQSISIRELLTVSSDALELLRNFRERLGV